MGYFHPKDSPDKLLNHMAYSDIVVFALCPFLCQIEPESLVPYRNIYPAFSET